LRAQQEEVFGNEKKAAITRVHPSLMKIWIWVKKGGKTGFRKESGPPKKKGERKGTQRKVSPGAGGRRVNSTLAGKFVVSGGQQVRLGKAQQGGANRREPEGMGGSWRTLKGKIAVIGVDFYTLSRRSRRGDSNVDED